MTDDEFFERLRGDARKLRHQPDERTLARIRARIHARLEPQPTVAELLARWFRPVAATAMALALAATIGVVTTRQETPAFGDASAEIEMAGSVYRVGD